jgi:hypothetical protein
MTPEKFGSALSSFELSVDEFAEESGVHRTIVYRWLREGDIPK